MLGLYGINLVYLLLMGFKKSLSVGPWGIIENLWVDRASEFFKSFKSLHKECEIDLYLHIVIQTL